MKNSKLASNWWNYVRDEELKPAFEFFPTSKSAKILEIGGGNGYQASKISEMGYSIISIDISPQEPSYYKVEKNDVTKLPYPDNSFDLILTSVVLQHIEYLDTAFVEMNRVLKNDGIMIHIVPTSWWSIFTNFWHYCQIPKFLINSFIKKIKTESNNYSEKNKQTINHINERKISKIKLLFFNPLGYNPSFLHEIFYFRKINWGLLERN